MEQVSGVFDRDTLENRPTALCTKIEYSLLIPKEVSLV